MSGNAKAIPWQQLMRFAFGNLRLSPAAFWSMTLPELNAALALHSTKLQQTPSHQWISEAMKDHPDRPAHEQEHTS